MKENKDEELQSRREFFKKTAQKALPIIAISVFGSALLSSCDKDDEPDGGCKGCSGGCEASCSGSCDDDCSGGCSGLCEGAGRFSW